MTDRDRQAFGLELTLAAEVLGADISAPLIAAYFDDLKAFDLPEVVEAIRQARKELQFLPKPVDLITRVRDLREERKTLHTSAQKSLMAATFPFEMTQEARAQFFALVNGIADGIVDKQRALFRPLTAEEQQIHEERKRLALQKGTDIADGTVHPG